MAKKTKATDDSVDPDLKPTPPDVPARHAAVKAAPPEEMLCPVCGNLTAEKVCPVDGNEVPRG